MELVEKNLKYMQDIINYYHILNTDEERKKFIKNIIIKDVIDFMKNKNNKFLELFKNCIEIHIKNGLTCNKIIDFYEFCSIFNKNIMKFILCNDKYDIFEIKKNNILDIVIKCDNENNNLDKSDSDIDTDSLDDNDNLDDTNNKDLDDNNSENLDDVKIYDPIYENPDTNLNFKHLRRNQQEAIQNMIKKDFMSGIHNQIMGAGKTWLILLTIKCHLEKLISEKKDINKLYVLACKHQEILRKMFFDNKGEICKNKKLEWKEKNIIDLDNFDIIKCIHDDNDINKNKDSQKKIDERLKKINRPTIIIINTGFMKKRLSSRNINIKNTHLCLLDECHDISGLELYYIANDIKYKGKVHFIGFSATPLRNRADFKVVDIFSSGLDINDNNKKLNVLSTYSLLDAIRDDIILPFKFHYIEVEDIYDKNIENKDKKLINENITKKVINDILPTLPYKKLIGWCKTINDMIRWAKFFKSNFKTLKLFISSYADNDYKNEYNTNFDEFYDTKYNSILLCVNRYREGSDIPYLDCGLYLDAVKTRSILVAMQTSGRIIRPDPNKLKTHGVIVDLFINKDKQNSSLLTIKKIIKYYDDIACLEINELARDKYKKLLKLLNDTDFDEKEQLIRIKLDNTTKRDIILHIKLIQKENDWQRIKEILRKEIVRQTNISKEEEFNHIIETLKNLNIFNLNSNFWEEYNNIENKDKLGLPKDLYNEFKEFFDKSSWYKLLDINTDSWLQTPEMVKKFLSVKKHYNINEKNYMEYAKKYKELPLYPKEFFKSFKFTTIEKEFNNDKKTLYKKL